MRVAFRVDANARIGSGHLVRCATLAVALREQGAQSRFICRALPESWQAWLTAQGLQWVDLGPATVPYEARPGDPAHAAWLETRWEDDAADTQRALGGDAWDWLVADHYALDARWEHALRPHARRLLAIDDLADRAHDVDALVDLNLHESAESRYTGKVPDGARLMLGPAFALLRPEFAAARADLRPRPGEVRRVLVFFGGFDAGNTTGRALQGLDGLRRDGIGPFAVDVVIGAQHPARDELIAYCAERPGWACHVQTDRMAELMMAADLAIGAGGGATWERCALGLPAIAVAQAANQVEQVDAVARVSAVCAPRLRDDSPAAWRVPIEALWFDPLRRGRMADAAHALVDARGAERVATYMARPPLSVRLARPSDSEFVFEGRNADAVRRASRTHDPIEREAHQRWYESILGSTARVMLIGEAAAERVGVLRWDIAADGASAEVSVYLAPGQGGRGLGQDLLAEAEAWLRRERPGVRTLVAEVLAGNAASIHLFEKAGYVARSQHFEKVLTPS